MGAKQKTDALYLAELLEPRLLLAADWVAAFAPVWTGADDAPAQLSPLDVSEYLATRDAPFVEPDASTQLPQSLDLNALVDLPGWNDARDTTQRHELVVIDAGVDGFEALAAEFANRNDGDVRYEVHILAADTDGVLALSSILADYHDIDAVHIVSHGDGDGIALGNTRLDGASIAAYADTLSGWSDALAADADLLIYGCDLAASDAGVALVDTLATLTHADVAASNDLTGHAQLGGDWDLEYTRGDIDSKIAFSAATQQSWSGVLATFTVNTLNDTVDANPGDGLALDADGNTSLRAAIMEANLFGGADVISLPAGTYQLTIAGDDDTAAAGDLDITQALTLVGAGAGVTVIDAQGIDRVLHSLTTNVVINDVTLTGGVAMGAFSHGGALFVEAAADATLERVLVTGNSAQNGGGVFANGNLTLNDVTVDTNSAAQNGGGLRLGSNSDLTTVAVSNNLAGNNGAGLAIAASANVTLTNVTISGNDATANGGGMRVQGVVNLINVTVTDNDAQIAGGGASISGGGSSLVASNTIFADNTAASGGADVNGAVTSDGSNIIKDSVGSGGFALSEVADPLLDLVLRDNGGSTRTHALQIGSPAIDGGTGIGAPAVDQRGYQRIGAIDVGAYEFGTVANGMPVAFDDDYAATADATLSISAIAGLLANDTDPDFDPLLVRILSGPLNGMLSVNPVGLTDLQNLSLHASDDVFPDWSPDSSQIAFSSLRDGDYEIYVINADGTGLAPITANTTSERQPVWSPDGTQILYRSNAASTYDIYVMDADGSNPVRLTTGVAADAASELDATWSPDGSKILYVMDDGAQTIYVMDADGSNVQPLTTPSPQNFTPDWSPDGTRIVFVSDRDGTPDIYVMDADGSNVLRLTNNAADVGAPSWSPDGSKILFHSDIDGDNELFAMDADGSNVSQITNNADIDRRAVWSPDGTRVVFESNSNGNVEIYVASIVSDGGFTYTPNPGFTGVDSFTYEATDGTAQSGPATVTLTVDTASATGSVDTTITSATDSTMEDTDLVFSVANGNAITVDDGTTNDPVLRTTLTATNGVLNLATTAGLTSVAGDGTNTVIMIGAESAINAALDGLTFSPTASFTGAANLQVTTDTQADLLGYYNFTQANPLGLDSSPAGGNDATPSAPGTLPDPNSVYDADRDSDVLLLDGFDDNLLITGRFGTPTNVTIAAWVNVTTTDEQDVVSIGSSIGLRLNDVNNGVGVTGFFHDGTGWNHTDTGQFVGGGDGWHHVAFSFDDVNNTQVIYLDGVALGTTGYAGSINWAHELNTTIGSHADGSSYWLGGMLDDIRVYDRALSESEIQAIAGDQFSDTEVVSITVQPVNSAPVLADDSPSLVAINEDDFTTAGDSVAAIVVDGSITDPDGAAVESIAITAVDDSNGAWQYSTDNGATWNDIEDGSLGAGHALLLDGTLVGADTQRIRFVPDPDFVGSPEITFRAWDMDMGVAGTYADTTASGGTSPFSTNTDTAGIIVNAVNDVPSFSTLGDQNVLEDAGAQTVTGFATALPGGGADESGQNFTYNVSSDNPGLFLVGPAIDASGTLTYTLNTNLNGTATVTVSVTDSGGTANGGVDTSADQTFDIVVGAVNDVPSFSTLGDQTVLEDSGPHSVAGFATALPGGGADESGQNFTYNVSSDNPGLFLVGPAIDASGTLTYTLNTNLNGTATVTVSVTDSGGTANGGVDTSADQTFDINVDAVNDQPVFSMSGDQIVLENSGAHTVVGFATALPGGGSDESGQSLTYTVNSNNPVLFISDPSIDASGTLTYTLSPNVSGTARVTVFVTDNGGTNDGGIDTSIIQSFDIIVGNIGDVPTLLLSTEGNQSGGDSPGLDDWNDDSLLGLGDPGFSLGPDAATSGVITLVFELDPFGNNRNIDGLHYVSSTLTVGSGSGTDFTLQRGDLLLTVDGGGDNTYTGLTTSITVQGSDVFVFRPQAPGDYSNGEFYYLLDNALGDDIHGIALVESASVQVGDGPALVQGTFLLSEDGGGEQDNVYTYLAQTVGDGTTVSLAGKQVLIDGQDSGGLGYSDRIHGIHLIEDDTTVGGVDFQAGDLLLALDKDQLNPANGVGTNNLEVRENDIFRLRMSETQQGPNGQSVGDAAMVFDGSAVGFDGGSESIDALTLLRQPPNTVPTATNLTQSHGYLEDAASVAIDDIVITDPDAGDTITANLVLADVAAGTLTATSGNGETYNAVSGVWQITGTVAQVNAALADVAFVPAANSVVNTSIATFIKDQSGFGPADGLITLNATAVNDVPSFSTLGNQNVLEDVGPQTVAGFATALPGGGADESGQNITYNVSSDNPGLFLVGPAIDASGTLTYTLNPNLNGTARVTVSVTDSGGTANGGVDTSADQTFDIVVGAVNDVPSFSTLGDQTVLEDSGPHSVAGFATALPGGGADESGQTFTYTVSSDNPGLFLVGPAIDAGGTLTYTLNPNLNGTARVTVSVTDSGGTANGGVDTSADQTFDIVVGAVNDVPSFSTFGDQTVLEDSGPHSVAGFATALPGGGADESGQTFTYTVSSDNPGLFLVGPAIDAGGTLTYTLNPNLNGTARVTVSVTDSGGTANGGVDTSADQTFDIVVGAVNDVPSFSTLGDQTVLEDSGPQTVAGFAMALPGGGTDESGQSFIYNVSNDNPGLFLVGPAIDAGGTLTYTLNPNLNGTARVTVSVTDSGGTANGGVDTSADQTFDIVVGAVNDVPSFSTLGDQTVLEDSGPQTVAGFAMALPGGGTDESGQSFIYNVSNDNPGLFLVGPAIDAGGTLTYTLNPNLNGTARVTVSVTDSGGTANGGVDTSADQTFDIVVGAVNDVPSFSTLGDQTVLEDSGPHSVAGFATALPGGGVDESGQNITYNVSSDNPGLFLVGPAIDASGTLTYTLNTNLNGTATVTVSVTDSGGTANGGVDTSADQTFDIVVGAVNDVPSFSTLGDQTVLEDSGPHSVAGFAMALPGGGTDESGQSFIYNVSNDNPGLFLVGPAIDASGTLTYTLNTNLNGTATVTVSVTDSGGTANGGVDTSADQTFDIVVGAVNDVPSFSTLGDQTVLEDAGAQTVAGFATALPGGGADESGQSFTYNVSIDNPGLFLVGPAIDAGGTLTYTLNPNLNGTARVTVSVTDSGGTANGGVDTSADQTFDIVVGAVNDVPSFSTLGDQTVLEDSGPHSVAGFATALPGGGTDESGQSFIYNVSNDNPGLFLVGPAIDSGGTLTYTLNANVNGTARVTVSVTDSGGTANGGVDTSADQTFDIVVGAVNDVPSFSTLGDQTVLEDSGPQTVAGFATALPGGGVDESGQNIAYNVSSDNPGLFLVGPAIDASGTLTYTLNPNLNGTARVTVSVTDSGGTANGGVDTSADQTFDIVVGAVNDVPSFSTLGDQTVLEDAGAQTVAGFATALPGGGADESGQSFTYNVSIDNPGLFLVGPAIDAGGTLTYTLNAGVSGSATISVSISDSGGTSNGGADTAAAATFDIVVTPADALPIASNLDQAHLYLEDSGPVALHDILIEVSGGGSLTATLTLSNVATGSLSSDSGNGESYDPVTGIWRVTGTAAQVNVALAAVAFVPHADNDTNASLVAHVEDAAGRGPDDGLITLSVTPVNDAPAGADKVITILDDTVFVFGLDNFGFSDAVENDEPAGVMITALPTATGSLTLRDTLVAVGDVVSVTDIEAGHLRFASVHALDQSAVATIAFRVQDAGGTADGGIDLDPAANFLTLIFNRSVEVLPKIDVAADSEAPDEQPVIDVADKDAADASAKTPVEEYVATADEEPQPAATPPVEFESLSPITPLVSDIGVQPLFGQAPVSPLSANNNTAPYTAAPVQNAAPASDAESRYFVDSSRTDIELGLNQMRDAVSDGASQGRFEFGQSSAAVFGLSVGYVSWLLRGGALLSSLLSSMPVWRFVDPLPVFARERDDESADGDAESLAQIIQRGSADAAAADTHERNDAPDGHPITSPSQMS